MLIVLILLTQRPIHEIFEKEYWELAELKNSVFLIGHFGIFFASFPWKSVNIYIVARMIEILIINLVYSKRVS